MSPIGKVRIATFHHPPWNILQYDSANKSQVSRFGGLIGEIVTHAFAGTGIDYEFVVQTKEEQFDEPDEAASLYAGTLGAVHRGEADLSGSCTTITAVRQRAFAYCQPLFESRVAILVVEDQVSSEQVSGSVAGPLQAYSGRLWLAIGVVALLVAVVGALLDVSNWRWRQAFVVGATNRGRRPRTIQTILRTLEELLRLVSHQGNTGDNIATSSSDSFRIVILSWATMCIVLTALYPAALFAVLTVRPRWTPPFHDVPSMLDADYRLGITGGSKHHFQHMLDRESALESPQVLTDANSIRNQSLRLAFLGWASYADDWQSSACDLRVVEPFDMAGDGIGRGSRLLCSVAIAKNATRLHRFLTRRIETLRAAGIVQALTNRLDQWRHDYDDQRPLHLRELCTAKRRAAEGVLTRVPRVAFAATRPMFRVLAVGVGAAALVLGVEWLFYRYV